VKLLVALEGVVPPQLGVMISKLRVFLADVAVMISLDNPILRCSVREGAVRKM
jgi:hypothetical protein